MKVCALGIPGLATGRHLVKDPRLDLVDKLVEAQRKTYVQVDVVGQEGLAGADVFVVTPEYQTELLLRDLEFVENRLERSPTGPEHSALVKLRRTLEEAQPASTASLDTCERESLLCHSALLTFKPMVVASKEALERPTELLVQAYAAAGYISFVTVGGKENRAWMLRHGAAAWHAAGVIHSDIQRGFIRAEVISFADLVAHGGETGAKRAGKQRLENRDYIVQDYDIIHFRFNR